jgi:hypothetical protein
MALPRNKIIASIFVAAVCLSTPVLADDSTISGRPVHRSDYLDDNYIYDYMNHRDSITIGLGDAPTSNIIIMHPTPWPAYINNTRIKITGQQGIDALDNMMQQSASGGASSSQGTSTSTPGVPPPMTGGLTGSTGTN